MTNWTGVLFSILAAMVVTIAAASAHAWVLDGTSGNDTWLVGASSSTGGTLTLCNTTTNQWVTWPRPTPDHPLDETGFITMFQGADVLRIVTNDGWYDCGYMYDVEYNGYSLYLIGHDGDDVLIGGTGVDVIYGDAVECEDELEGDDYLASGGGADQIYGCLGDDTFDLLYGAGSGTDVYGGEGADCIESNANVEVWCNVDGDNTDGVADDYNNVNGGTHCWSQEGDAATTSLVCA